MSSEIPEPVPVFEEEKSCGMDTLMKGVFETFAEGVVIALKSGNAEDATEQYFNLRELIEKIKKDEKREMIKKVVRDVYVTHLTELQMRMDERIAQIENVVLSRMKKNRDAVEQFLKMV